MIPGLPDFEEQDYQQSVLPGFEEYVEYEPKNMYDIMTYYYKGYINWETVELFKDRLLPKVNLKVV